MQFCEEMKRTKTFNEAVQSILEHHDALQLVYSLSPAHDLGERVIHFAGPTDDDVEAVQYFESLTDITTSSLDIWLITGVEGDEMRPYGVIFVITLAGQTNTDAVFYRTTVKGAKFSATAKRAVEDTLYTH